MVDLTVPIDSSNVVRSSVQRTEWSETVSWDFDTKMSRQEYAEWLEGKLRDRFRAASRADSQLNFTRNLDGDTEDLTVRPD
jgi:hypothetical protein